MFKEYAAPTKKPDQSFRPIDLTTAQWRIEIKYQSGVGTNYKSWTMTGTEMQAKAEAKRIRNEFQKTLSEDQYIYICRIICTWIPEWYERKYGTPTKHYCEDIQ